jgi:hypothetical protein
MSRLNPAGKLGLTEYIIGASPVTVGVLLVIAVLIQ